MKRTEMIDYIIHNAEEFETMEYYIELAKMSNHKLRTKIIRINNYILNN